MTESKENNVPSIEETTVLETDAAGDGVDEAARKEALDALGDDGAACHEAGNGGGRGRKRLAAVIGACAGIAIMAGLAYALCTQPIGAGAGNGSGSSGSDAVVGSAGSGEVERKATASFSVEAPEWTDEAGTFKILVKAKDGGGEQEVEVAPGEPAEVELSLGGYTATLAGIPTLPDGKTYKVPKKQEFTVDEDIEADIKFSLELMDLDDEAAVEAAIEALPEDEREAAREKYTQKKADPNRPSAGSSSGASSGSSSGGSSSGGSSGSGSAGGGSTGAGSSSSGSSSGDSSSSGSSGGGSATNEPEKPAHTHSYTIPYYEDVYKGRQERYICGCGEVFNDWGTCTTHRAAMAEAGTPCGNYIDDSYDIWESEIAGYECSCGARS